MEKHAFIQLIRKYLAGDATPEETRQLHNYYDSFRQDEDWNEASLGSRQDMEAALLARIRGVIDTHRMQHGPEGASPVSSSPAPPHTRGPRLPWRKLSIAAAILTIALSTWLLYRHAPTSPLAQRPAAPIADTTITKPIAPATQGAILTLADGQTIALDSSGNAPIPAQAGTELTMHNGQLVYDAHSAAGTTKPDNATAGGANTPTTIGSPTAYNTMSTPRGRHFQLRLADGTRVWLNALSSLRYPTTFSGATRTVEVHGEAYFEVAADKTKPFIVELKDNSRIQVLGTHFNVNAYDDEKTTHTTLLEGSVRVFAATGDNKLKPLGQAGSTEPGGQGGSVSPKPGQTAAVSPRSGQKGATSAEPGAAASVLLKPGQQASQTTGSAFISVANVDVDKVMAWNNNLFDFDGVSLADAMRQLARWYDIEVVYEKGIPDIQFMGEMSRSISLEGLIRILQSAEVHFRIEGRRLIVYP